MRHETKLQAFNHSLRSKLVLINLEMEPVQNICLESNLEKRGNTKGDATKTASPVMQSFSHQTMNQTNQRYSRPGLLRPQTWTGGSAMYNFVNSSFQRKYSAPRYQPCRQRSLPLNQFSYFTPPVFTQQTAPRPTTEIMVKNDWQNKSQSETLSEQRNGGSTGASTGASHSMSDERYPTANHLRSQPNIDMEVENAIRSKHSSERKHTTNQNKQYRYSDVASRSVAWYNNGNSLSQHISETKRYHPYINKSSSENGDYIHRKHGVHEYNGGSDVPYNVQRRYTESPSKMTSTGTVENIECKASETNALPSVKGDEENVIENLGNKNAEELLLSMTNRRIKINRLLEEQKRLMANLHVMKTETPTNNVNEQESRTT